MADQVGKENSDMVCTWGDMHKGHISWLTLMGLLNEVNHLCCNPTISCSKCGANANLLIMFVSQHFRNISAWYLSPWDAFVEEACGRFTG
jgi:hypothetical protein